MYQLVRANLRSKRRNSIWERVDISFMLMDRVFNDYLDGIITLTHPTINGEIFVALPQLRLAPLPFSNVSFTTWLTTLGGASLPHLSTDGPEPSYNASKVLFNDAWKAGYNIDRVHPVIGDSQDLPIGDLTDLYLSRHSADFTKLQQHVLTTVNGLLHLNIPYQTGLKIKAGAKSLDLTSVNFVGLLSFHGIGVVRQVAIQPTDILATPQPLLDEAYINLDMDLRNKTVLMSLGGILHLDDGAYDVVNAEAGLIKINFRKLDMVTTLFKIREIIDLGSLGLTLGSNGQNGISPNEAYSDVVLTRFLLLAQSFVIVVDCPMLHAAKIPLKRTGLMGVYDSVSEPLYPMVDSYGRMPEYWRVRYSDLDWGVKVYSHLYTRFLMSSANQESPLPVASNQVGVGGYEIDDCYLLEISCVTPA